MHFNSLSFVYFLVLVLGGLALVPQRLRNSWILGAGIFFYASWNPGCILLLLGNAILSHQAALGMLRATGARGRKAWLIAGVTISAGSLLVFKYAQMGVNTIAWAGSALWGQWQPPFLDIVLPLGISFYTFEILSYLIDVWRRELEPCQSLAEYLGFLMFFPKLIAGPIVRAHEFLPQLNRERSCDWRGATEAVHLLAIGFGKKILLADNFAPFIEKVFANPGAHNRWACLVAAFGYSMQVYFDFSAYTDIARGCGKLMGFELPLNFRRPYLATSISDFWRRWHMTLSRWLRDYVYVPLGGNRSGRWRTNANLMLTMLVGGLWHGANWTFVAWGGLNGLLLVTEKTLQRVRKKNSPPMALASVVAAAPSATLPLAHCSPCVGTPVGLELSEAPDRSETLGDTSIRMGMLERIARIALVFSLITMTRVFFRAESFPKALEMFQTIFAPGKQPVEMSVAMVGIPLGIVGYMLLSSVKERWLGLSIRGWMIPGYAAYLVALLFLGGSRSEFIYFQF